MIKWNSWILFALSSVMIFTFESCQQHQNKKVIQTTQSFLSALKEQKITELQNIYPNVDNIDLFIPADTALIDKISILPNKGYQVYVTCYYLDSKDNLRSNPVIFYLYPVKKMPTKYYIKDSYGLAKWKNYPHYRFAVKTGCVRTDTYYTDQEALSKLRVAKDILFYFTKQMYNELDKNIKIRNTTILSKQGNSIKGNALVENRSNYTLPDLRYVIQYYNNSNQKVGKEGGWVTKTPFESGKAILFDFVSFYYPEVSNISLELDFDLDLILQFVMDDTIYNGLEYKNFISQKYIYV